mmetsp:Transcript_30471/g.70257  ORF Transcript_30471/g.70257 Transcript_30471/m.70257 type:complete len:148 (-) Transcript_30471:47-490(-)
MSQAHINAPQSKTGNTLIYTGQQLTRPLPSEARALLVRAKIDRPTLLALAEKLPQLAHLDMLSSGEAIRGSDIVELAKKWPHLEAIDCRSVGKFGYAHFKQTIALLQRLKLFDIPPPSTHSMWAAHGWCESAKGRFQRYPDALEPPG